jgi:thiol:disulfide interchange protein DsbD
MESRATLRVAAADSGAGPRLSIFASDIDIARLFEGNALLVFASFLVFGLLLSFTPCVLPMIPILSGIIAGEGAGLGKLRAFALSLSYVLGMALAYAVAGVAAALSGTLLAAALQNVWVLGAFALMFVALALSMFGFYDLQLPGFVHQRLHGAQVGLRGGRIASVAAMGVLSAVIVSPCVAAPLAGALLYISQTRDVALGAAALFAMALGMGVPLIAVGVSEGALLPKAGAWMGGVRKFFGVLLLAVALWIVTPVLPALAVMLAWAALLIGSAMLLRALDPLPPQASGWWRLWKGAGIIALVAGAAILVGALAGGRDPLRPLASLMDGAAEAPTRWTRVASLGDLEERLRAPGRPVMLDFYADWCVSCKEMEKFTFSDPRVRAQLERMLLLQADVTAANEADRLLLKRFSLFGPPGIIFFDAEGREIKGLRVIGYQAPERFLKTLAIAAGD